MKTLFTLLFLFSLLQTTWGQVATIRDSDGWVNIRSAPNKNAEIIHQVYKNELFWYGFGDDEGEWVTIDIPKNRYSFGPREETNITGFIHKSRILPLEKLPEYNGSDFAFQYILSDFDSSHRIIDRIDGGAVVAIDGRPVWGTDGNLPSTQVEDIKVTLGGKKIDIHEVFYSDIYECRNEYTIYINGDTYFVSQVNSDGAGGYQIVWVIDANGLRQRLIDHPF